MANSVSAKKRIRQNAKRRARNRWRKGQVTEVVKQYDQAVESGDSAKAAELLNLCYKKIDQVTSKGTFHKKTASRQKARLAKKLNKISA